ncbi:MAG: DinB family protein [Deltaproteobacteria bacterium]
MAAGRIDFSAAFIASLEDKLDGGDVIGALRRSPSLFRKAASAASPKWLASRPAGDCWSRGDILAHMLDTETVMSFRIRKIICEEDPNISFFDQEKWIAGLRTYRDRKPERLVARFSALRAENVALLSSLNEEQMKRTGVHPESGRMTLEALAARMARHDINHLKQILAG